MYFELTGKMMAKILQNNDANDNNNYFVIKSLSNIFKILSNDNSDFKEWRIRHCIDMSMRSFASVVTFVNHIIFLIALYETWLRTMCQFRIQPHALSRSVKK